MTRILFSTAACITLAGAAVADCPPVTVADTMGVPSGEFPQQYELSEFESLAGCTLSFSENPDIAELNSRIRGNPDLAAAGRAAAGRAAGRGAVRFDREVRGHAGRTV